MRAPLHRYCGGRQDKCLRFGRAPLACSPIADPHGMRVSIGHRAQETQDVDEALEATQPRADRAEAA
jgi:hypothetical protein